MKGKIAVGFIAVSLALSSQVGAAEGMPASTEDNATYAGLLAGLTFPTGGTKFQFGATLGHKFTPVWGAGLYLTHWSTSIPALSGTVSNTSTVAAAEGSYFFPDLVGLRAGGKVGLNFVGGAGIDTSNALVVGPHLGYDYQVSQNVSFGGEFNLLFQTKTGQDALTSLLVALKYWF